MVKPRTLSPQSVWDISAVLQAWEDAGVPNASKQAHRMWGWLIRHPLASWTVRCHLQDAPPCPCSSCGRAGSRQSFQRAQSPCRALQDVPDLPKAAVAALNSGFVRFSSKLHAVQRSTDGETFKLLLSLQDGMRVEAVVMNYDTRPAVRAGATRSGDADAEAAPVAEAASSEATSSKAASGGHTGNQRSTLCVSSQVGCQMGCTFCATGEGGKGCDERLSGDDRQRTRRMRSADLSAPPANSALSCACQACAVVVRRVQRRHDGAEGQPDDGRDCGAARLRVAVRPDPQRGLHGHGAPLLPTAHLHCPPARLTAGSPPSITIACSARVAQGEPLDNYAAVRSAVEVMTDSRLFSLQRRHVTVSTVGVIPRILSLASDLPGISLALSLHAPNQARLLRQR